MNYLTPRVPENCLVCGAKYIGGHELPGNRMKIGLRCFYYCGSSISVRSEHHDGCFQILIKGCWCEHNKKTHENS